MSAPCYVCGVSNLSGAATPQLANHRHNLSEHHDRAMGDPSVSPFHAKVVLKRQHVQEPPIGHPTPNLGLLAMARWLAVLLAWPVLRHHTFNLGALLPAAFLVRSSRVSLKGTKGSQGEVFLATLEEHKFCAVLLDEMIGHQMFCFARMEQLVCLCLFRILPEGTGIWFESAPVSPRPTGRSKARARRGRSGATRIPR